MLGADDLVIKLHEFREATFHKVPIGIKMGAGRVNDDIKIAYKDGFDFVELDGLQGSTGAASTEVLENVGIPTLAAVQEAIDGLAEIDAGDDMDLVMMGGLKDGVDIVKMLALGCQTAPRSAPRRLSPAAASPACSVMSAPARSASPPRIPNTRRVTTSTSRR